MIGVGFQPFGITPVGLGAIEPGTSLNGVAQEARYIDPVSKDFIADDDGQIIATDTVKQRVYLALNTSQTSSSVDQSFGNRLRSIQFIGDNYASLVRSLVRQALKQLTDVEKVISLISIDVQTETDKAIITVNYQNRVTNFSDSVSVSP